MCRTHFRNLSRSQVTAWRCNSEPWKKCSDIVGKFSTCKFIKKFWVHFHCLCVQKRSCFPWNSDAFQKFSACKFCRESSGRIFTIYASKNEAVPCKIQTHFKCFLPARFAEKVLGAFSQSMHPKLKLFPVKFRPISEVFWLQDLQRKFWSQFHDYPSKNEAVFHKDVFWKFSLCEVYEKVLGTFSRFMRLKTKLFALKFKRISEVFALRCLWKKFWVHFHDLCIQKWSCFP